MPKRIIVLSICLLGVLSGCRKLSKSEHPDAQLIVGEWEYAGFAYNNGASASAPNEPCGGHEGRTLRASEDGRITLFDSMGEEILKFRIHDVYVSYLVDTIGYDMGFLTGWEYPVHSVYYIPSQYSVKRIEKHPQELLNFGFTVDRQYLYSSKLDLSNCPSGSQDPKTIIIYRRVN